jgi:NitT/TauT family transport system substrate-binding protein
MKRMVLAIVALLAAWPASAADKVTLMLNWYVYGEHAPFYYGKEKGYFKDAGIDLDIQEGRGSATVTQVVAAGGTAQFGYVDVPTMMRAAVKGAPVEAVGVALQTNPMSVMGFADKNIRKPEDIKGKTVATTPGDSMSQIWPLFLKRSASRTAISRPCPATPPPSSTPSSTAAPICCWATSWTRA